MIRDESGQSTLEFAFAMALVMGFALFFIQLCMLFAYGNLVHYATFMSARTLLSARAESGEQEDAAREVLVQLLKRSIGQPGIEKYPFIARGDGEGDVPGLELGGLDRFNRKDRSLSWQQGVRYRFKANLSLIPVRKGQGDEGLIRLVSESFLGKDTSFESCQSRMGRLGAGKKGAIFDNGC